MEKRWKKEEGEKGGEEYLLWEGVWVCDTVPSMQCTKPVLIAGLSWSCSI